MIAALIALLGSSTVGSLVGGIFAFLNRKVDVDMRKLELEHEVAKWGFDLQKRAADLEIVKAEAQGRKEVAIVEGESTVEAARFDAIGKAQEADKITADEIKAAGTWGWLLVLASALRGFIRPVITIVLVGAAVYLNWVLIGRLTEGWATLTPAQQFEAGMQAFAWVTGQASAVLAYWFVSRGSSGTERK